MFCFTDNKPDNFTEGGTGTPWLWAPAVFQNQLTSGVSVLGGVGAVPAHPRDTDMGAVTCTNDTCEQTFTDQKVFRGTCALSHSLTLRRSLVCGHILALVHPFHLSFVAIYTWARHGFPQVWCSKLGLQHGLSLLGVQQLHRCGLCCAGAKCDAAELRSDVHRRNGSCTQLLMRGCSVSRCKQEGALPWTWGWALCSVIHSSVSSSGCEAEFLHWEVSCKIFSQRKLKNRQETEERKSPKTMSVPHPSVLCGTVHTTCCSTSEHVRVSSSVVLSTPSCPHTDSDLDLAVQPCMPLNSDLAERDESFPSDSYPELLLFTQASWVETLGWRACGNNSLQVLAAIWKLWCRKKNRVTSLSSKWAFLLPRANVALTPFNTSSLTGVGTCSVSGSENSAWVEQVHVLNKLFLQYHYSKGGKSIFFFFCTWTAKFLCQSKFFAMLALEGIHAACIEWPFNKLILSHLHQSELETSGQSSTDLAYQEGFIRISIPNSVHEIKLACLSHLCFSCVCRMSKNVFLSGNHVILDF